MIRKKITAAVCAAMILLTGCKGGESASIAVPASDSGSKAPVRSSAANSSSSSTAPVRSGAESTSSLVPETPPEPEPTDESVIFIKVNGVSFTADLEDNSSAKALVDLLKNGDLTIDMHDYGSFEKVGGIGTSLPRNDTQITTKPGDIILYQGNQITIYYDINSWNFTLLGKIRGASQSELKNALGSGNALVTFSLTE